jgi:Domain of unknown function (DUF4303)
MNKAELHTWLSANEPDLVDAIASDIENHVSSLRAAGVEFYSYAVLPSDYCTSVGPPTIVVAYNRESDILNENKGSIYYRYSVDEWPNYVHDGFDKSNSILKEISQKFSNCHQPDPNRCEIDNEEIAYVNKLYSSVVKALKQLKDNSVFSDIEFLIVWLSDSGHQIMHESAAILNNSDIFKKFKSEFS